MRLYIDMTGKQVSVSKEPGPTQGPNGCQHTERETGRPMWSTQVFVLDSSGGEVITVTTEGDRPNVTVGQLVTPIQMEVQRLGRSGKKGVAFRAAELRAAPTMRT